MDENKVLERVGVGIGEDEAYRVYKSLSVRQLPNSETGGQEERQECEILG